jgi:hypothetical protein
MSLRVDDSHLREEWEYMNEYMEKVRDEAISLLSPMQLAAIFEDYHDFCVRYNEEQDRNRAEAQYE